MANNQSSFENLLGDRLSAFTLALQGAFRDWSGFYNVLLPDKRKYLIQSQLSNPKFNPFCSRIRRSNEGEELCLQCDLKSGQEAFQLKKGVLNLCHAGMIDIAVPIIAGGQLLASIHCGQVRLDDDKWDSDALELVKVLGKSLNLSNNELVDLFYNSPKVAHDELNQIAQNISTIALFISEMLDAQLLLAKTNSQLTQTQSDQISRAHRHEQMFFASQKVIPLSESWNSLWDKCDDYLKDMSSILRADACSLLICDSDTISNKFFLKSSANLPTSIKRNMSFSVNGISNRLNPITNTIRLTFNPNFPGSLCHEIQKSSPEVANVFSTVAGIHFSLLNHVTACLLMYYRGDESSLANDEQDALLSHTAHRIAIAYHNTNAYITQLVERDRRLNWLKQVSHQIISPLNGLVGYAEYLQSKYESWQIHKSPLLEHFPSAEYLRHCNIIESMLGTGEWAARLTRNLLWSADPDPFNQLTDHDFELVDDLYGYMIDCARMFQGIARDRGLGKIQVLPSQFSELKSRIFINKDLFRQAVQNLLDNAVKYSDKGKDTVIEALSTNAHCRIHVINFGLKIKPQDIDRIFIDEERTEEAKARYPTGTGIGLPIARQIITAHKGTLSVEPSVLTDQGWMTVFSIQIPLVRTKK